MKAFSLFSVILLFCSFSFSQNVGIGIATPLYKLDVAGNVRNSNTTLISPGLFGRLTSGGALRIENNDNLKFLVIDGSTLQAQLASGISSGTDASPLLINPFGGNVGVGTTNPNATLTVARGKGGDGTAAFAGTNHVSHFNYSNGESTYIRGGKTGSKVFINDSHYGDVDIATGGGSINTGNAIYSVQTGGLNIVPLGIIKYVFSLDGNGNPFSVNVTNEAGSLYTGWGSSTTTGADDETTFTINLDFAQASSYSTLVAIGSPEFEISLHPVYVAKSTITKTGTAASLVIYYKGDCLTCEFSSLIAQGTYIIYGIK